MFTNHAPRDAIRDRHAQEGQDVKDPMEREGVRRGCHIGSQMGTWRCEELIDGEYPQHGGKEL